MSTRTLQSKMNAVDVTPSMLAAVSDISLKTIESYLSGTRPGAKNRARLDAALDSENLTSQALIAAEHAKLATARTKGTGKQGRYGPQGDVFERLWSGLRVEDAPEPLSLNILPEDIDVEARKDPAHCIWANSAKRMYGSKHVVFFKNVAYVELVNGEGERIVYRYMLSKQAHDMLCAFDETDADDPPADGRVVTLKPPTKGRTLEHCRRGKRRRLKGKYCAPEHRERAQKAAKTRAEAEPLDIRSGTGQWHMN